MPPPLLLPERVTLVLAGQGALLEACRTLAQTLGVQDRVVFPGFVQPAEPWFVMADAVLSTSRSEGLPFNLMEAMYAGRPVAASAVKGHTDLIRDGENGLLFPFSDADACAAAIARLERDPALCARLGAAAHADAQQYRLERVFPLVWEQYLSLTK
jgi:glycosyltransferase EpsD